MVISEFILCSIQIMVLVFGYNVVINLNEMNKVEPTIEASNP